MPSPYIIKIKIQPYIKKYLIAHSENKEEPLSFGCLHTYGDQIIELLSNYNSHSYFSIHEKKNIEAYFNRRWIGGEWLQIRLPYNRSKNIRCYNYFSLYAQREFIARVKVDFYQDLYKFLKYSVVDGVRRKEVLQYFLDLYNITEDDIKFESIYRQSSRMLEFDSPKNYKIFNHRFNHFVL